MTRLAADGGSVDAACATDSLEFCVSKWDAEPLRDVFMANCTASLTSGRAAKDFPLTFGTRKQTEEQ